MQQTLALVGCGGMGSSLLKGWLTLSESPFQEYWVITPHQNKVEPFLQDKRVKWFSNPEQLPQSPTVIVLAVKPYILDDILEAYKPFESLFISVAAGKPLTFFGLEGAIARAMPNTPVAIHQGIIGLLPSPNMEKEKLILLQSCFQELGQCIWVSSDEEIDKITAISGSGPAYMFYLIESYTQAIKEMGFDQKTAERLALGTFRGAVNSAFISDSPPSELREQVTSPHGTTYEGLKVLKKADISHILKKTINAAYKRARELMK